MTDIAELQDKLRKIEALLAGAGTPGEKAAAGAAADRIRAKLGDLGATDPAVEIRYSLPDPWSRRLFIALCRRYGLKPHRFARMKRQTVIVKAPRSFQETVLWPEFKEANAALSAFLSDITDKVIRDTIFRDASDADEVDEPRVIP